MFSQNEALYTCSPHLTGMREFSPKMWIHISFSLKLRAVGIFQPDHYRPYLICQSSLLTNSPLVCFRLSRSWSAWWTRTTTPPLRCSHFPGDQTRSWTGSDVSYVTANVLIRPRLRPSEQVRVVSWHILKSWTLLTCRMYIWRSVKIWFDFTIWARLHDCMIDINFILPKVNTDYIREAG